MPAAPQGGGQGGDNSTGILWGIAAIFATGWGLWYFFQDHIVAFYLLLKYYELSILSMVGKVFNHPYYFDALKQALLNARMNASAVSFEDMLRLGASVGVWWRIPLAILLLILAVVVYLGNTARMFRRTYSMKDFAKLESKNWPQITPVLNLDLINTDIDTGPWSMAMTPMQFCKRNNLLEEVRILRPEAASRKDRDRLEVVLKRGEANQVFSMQLGPLFTGPQKLPLYMRALLAVFAARVNADSKGAADLVAQMAASSLNKEMNFSGADDLLKKHQGSKLVQTVFTSHAYVTTVMAAMLLAARDDGVQPSCDFLWLKPRDRKLWYVLNTVGRQTPFVEVAGIFAHWVAEREAGRKLLVPMVEEATNAVELALKEVVYNPDEY